MNKKIISVCLSLVIACGIFVGCQKKAPEKVAVIVTDKNGVAVTDKNGEVVTELAEPVTDEEGNHVTQKATNAAGEVITDASGNPKTVVVTQSESNSNGNSDSSSVSENAQTGKSQQTTTAASPEGATKAGENTNQNTTVKAADTTKTENKKEAEVPYYTTAPQNNKTLDEWTFGNASKVGCNAPNGWKNETVNQVVKEGTDIRVQICPINYLKQSGYNTADDYAKFYEDMSSLEEGNPKKVSYSKEVYKDGVGIALLYKTNKATSDASGYTYGKYHMTYIYETDNRVRVYFVFGNSEEEARTSIADVITNTYYRG